ncbi:MAG: CoA ester lyase [Betaproteobacteria bacterium]|nr:CoA ester lyase [Betaproteobacteria bacterium]
MIPSRLCRSWLFVPGADEPALAAAAASGADVLIQELEDFTPPARRAQARLLAPGVFAAWREAGAVVAVRVNPLDGDGIDDLAAVMRGAPDVVALPKVAEPDQVRWLDSEIARFERDCGIAIGSTRLLPNIEFARGLVQAAAIAKASPRVEACLLASEDLAADLGAERGRDGLELAYARQRFLVECVAAGVAAVDAPYTWRDAEGVERDTGWARRLGYRAKSVVDPAHAAIVNRVLTPSADEVAHARRLIAAFESSRERGEPRAELDGSLVEVPAPAARGGLATRARPASQLGGCATRASSSRCPRGSTPSGCSPRRRSPFRRDDGRGIGWTPAARRTGSWCPTTRRNRPDRPSLRLVDRAATAGARLATHSFGIAPGRATARTWSRSWRPASRGRSSTAVCRRSTRT